MCRLIKTKSMKQLIAHDFKMTPINNISPMFNVEVLVSVERTDKETKEKVNVDEFTLIGYGLPFYVAAEKIIAYRAGKHDPADLKGYLDVYTKELRELKQMIEEYIKESFKPKDDA